MMQFGTKSQFTTNIEKSLINLKNDLILKITDKG